MNTGQVYLSFWDICLDNLPEGTFRHRRITADDARHCIERAREENKLLCVADADLAAPFKKRESQNHEELCSVLRGHLGITLSLEDFFSKDDQEDEALYFVNPLNCVQIHADAQLLVITCAYILSKEQPASAAPVFDIDRETIEFHIIEAEP
jgi:hypothetical protein